MARVESANQAHRAILTALEQRDSSEAQRLVVDHIRRSREQSLAEQSGSSVPVSLGSISLPEFVRRDLSSR